MTSERVLLTGGAGFLGAHVLEHLLTNTDWHIVCVCSWRHKGKPERIDEVLRGHDDWRSRVEIVTHDLSAPFPELTKQRLGAFDYILNLAAESHVDRSIEDPRPFFENNVGVALTMLEFAREVKPKIFIQFSTDEVMGVAPFGVNHAEWAPIVPSNPYSASKAAQEAAAIAYWRTYGVPLIITNCMNIFGPMQDAEKYLAKCIRLIDEGGEVPVHGKPGKIGTRFYISARNVADALLFLLRKGTPTAYVQDEETRPDRYNIVGDAELDNLQIAEAIANILGKPLRYRLVNHHDTRPGHDYRYALDGAKLREAGWKAPVGFEESLRTYIAWTLARPMWL